MTLLHWPFWVTGREALLFLLAHSWRGLTDLQKPGWSLGSAQSMVFEGLLVPLASPQTVPQYHRCCSGSGLSSFEPASESELGSVVLYYFPVSGTKTRKSPSAFEMKRECSQRRWIGWRRGIQSTEYECETSFCEWEFGLYSVSLMTLNLNWKTTKLVWGDVKFNYPDLDFPSLLVFLSFLRGGVGFTGCKLSRCRSQKVQKCKNVKM